MARCTFRSIVVAGSIVVAVVVFFVTTSYWWSLAAGLSVGWLVGLWYWVLRVIDAWKFQRRIETLNLRIGAIEAELRGQELDARRLR